MQSKLLVALFAALALTACQKAEEAAAPAMDEAPQITNDAANSDAIGAPVEAEAAAGEAGAAGDVMADDTQEVAK